jgi:hypothetical protein
VWERELLYEFQKVDQPLEGLRVSRCVEVGFDDLGAPDCDQLARLLLEERQLDQRERLKAGAEFTLQAACAARDPADEPGPLRHAEDDLIGVGQLIGL